MSKVIFAAAALILILISQVALVNCPECGARPGLWLLAVWTLFLDFDLYFADTIMLKECPKCKSSLKTEN